MDQDSTHLLGHHNKDGMHEPPPSYEEAMHESMQRFRRSHDQVHGIEPDTAQASTTGFAIDNGASHAPAWPGSWSNTNHPSTGPPSTIIPDGSVLLPQDCPPLGHFSNAETAKTKALNVESFDALLDHDADELWRFFMSHLQKPQLFIKVHGTHTESRERTETNPNGTTTRTDRDEEVTDFCFMIDVTRYVETYWSRIVCVRESDDATRTLRETLEEYTTCTQILKEIHMTKQPIWDFKGLSQAIEYAVRNAGYIYKVEISYPQHASKVSAFSSHIASRILQNTWAWLFLVISCLWIIAWPAFYILRKRVGTRIVCEFPMSVSGPDFYAKNYWMIVGLVRDKSLSTVEAV